MVLLTEREYEDLIDFARFAEQVEPLNGGVVFPYQFILGDLSDRLIEYYNVEGDLCRAIDQALGFIIDLPEDEDVEGEQLQVLREVAVKVGRILNEVVYIEYQCKPREGIISADWRANVRSVCEHINRLAIETGRADEEDFIIAQIKECNANLREYIEIEKIFIVLN